MEAARQVSATIPEADLPSGSVLYTHLGCGGGAGSNSSAIPQEGAGADGESATPGSSTTTGSGAAGGTAQGDNAGGGGGGASALCVVATAASDCSGGTIIAVAGGGGGAAGAVSQGAAPPAVSGASGGQGAPGSAAGGSGDASGCSGTGGTGSCSGGGGGTGTAPGSGGSGALAGTPGSAGNGGSASAAGSATGGNSNAAGGGGGGGLYGGGGGAAGQSTGPNASVSGTGGGAGSSLWNTGFGASPTFSTVSTAGPNCGASTSQCTDLSSGNGSGGQAGRTGANGVLEVTFTVGGVAADSSFSTQPSSTAASGTAFATQPAVTLEDAAAALVGGDPVRLSIATHPVAGSGTLTCTANPMASDSSGIAAFAGCAITGPVGSYTLEATDTADGAVVATSTAVTVVPGPAAQLVFVTGPSGIQAGSTITPAVTVSVEDSSGNVETADNTTQVGLTIGNTAGGATLTGGGPVTVSDGVATFAGLSVDRAGSGYTLVASSTPAHPPRPRGRSTSCRGQPTGWSSSSSLHQRCAGAAMAAAVTVAVEDASGNVETGDSTTTVSLSFGTNPGHAVLTGGGLVTVSDGVATLAGLSVDRAGSGYTLVASSSPSYASSASTSFSVTPGAPTQLAFVQQPTATSAGAAISPAVRVAVEDAQGNVETGDNTTTVTMNLGTNTSGATLSGGGPVTVSSGVATFAGLSVDRSASGYSLVAASIPAHASATSSAFAVTPGAPTKLVFVQQPTITAAGAAFSPAVTVAVEDALGNVETGDNATQITLELGTNPGAATVSAVHGDGLGRNGDLPDPGRQPDRGRATRWWRPARPRIPPPPRLPSRSRPAPRASWPSCNSRPPRRPARPSPRA